jgi:hypothetical protein
VQELKSHVRAMAALLCGYLKRGKRDLMGRSSAAMGEEVGVIPSYDEPGQNAGKRTNGAGGGAQG